MAARHLTLGNGRKVLLNTPDEHVSINAGIAADADTFELNGTAFKQLRRPGRPLGSGTKMQVALRPDGGTRHKRGDEPHGAK